MSKFRRSGRRATAAVIFTGFMLAASVAFASWVATGTGSGSAKAITATNLTVTGGTPTAQLYPGGTGDLFVTIQNTNPYAVNVTSVARTATAISSDKGAACDASTGVSMSTPQTVNWTINANSSANFTLSGVMSMSNASDTTCQGATFTVPITVTGASA